MQPVSEFIDVKYPILTVLLDLTANEDNIVKVAEKICEQQVLEVVLDQSYFYDVEYATTDLRKLKFLSRFRDMVAGVVLNVTCNVHSTIVIQHILKCNVVNFLL